MEKETRKISKCLRCGWIWIPRMEKPYVCPKCKSYKWNEAK